MRQRLMHIFFDLDGTLTNPFKGITRCIQHALKSLGREVPEAEDLRWCIGPPLHASFLVLLETNDEQIADEALRLYRERFSTVGLFENEVYPGIVNCLSALTDTGYRMRVATAKPTVYAQRIVEHFELDGFFEAVHGSELDGRRTDKTELIAHILRENGDIDGGGAVMIGDRSHDMIGAVNNGLAPLGVAWGFGSREELTEAGALAFVRTSEELTQEISKLNTGKAS